MNTLTNEVKGHSYTYDAGGFSYTLNYALIDLKDIPCVSPAGSCLKTLSYRCGDKAWGFSSQQHVQIHDESALSTPGPQIAIVGDMGIPAGQKTIDSLAERILEPFLDSERGVAMLLHVGDITYADTYSRTTQNNSYVWVDYMNSMQAVAAKVPYMTAPGNHESQFDFAAYLNWLPMPHNASQSDSPFWFSFDYLGVHVLSFSTEHDFSHHSPQRLWMEQDLKEANKNRTRVPWVVVIGHRPLYCSSVLCQVRCQQKAVQYRNELEDLLYEEGVDVMVTGHNHHFERSYPVYRSQVTQWDYVNPEAPVYIVNGAAGSPEILDPTFQSGVPWRAWYQTSTSTSFLLMSPSQSQLTFDYVVSDTNDVTDSFTIVKQ